MAKYKVIILERAVSEFEDACLYYNYQLPGLGFEFEEKIFALIELINDNPLVFPIKFAYIREAVGKAFPVCG